jgi:predicted DNA binding CopG/RHH family protein
MKDLEPKRQSWETVDYSDNPDLPKLEDMVEISRDFLPKPEDLVFKKPTRKITIALDQESIDFFKAEAKRLNIPYQRMIRALLQEYVERAK